MRYMGTFLRFSGRENKFKRLGFLTGMESKALPSLMVMMLLLSGCLGLDGEDQQMADYPPDPTTEPTEFNDTALTLEPDSLSLIHI